VPYLPPFLIVELPGAAVAVGGTIGSCVVIRPPTDTEIDAMADAASANEIAGLVVFYGLAGLTLDQASELPEPALNLLIASISQVIAPALLRNARDALSYNPSR
jgi:hypothetical protein